jgi:hypothetical protein
MVPTSAHFATEESKMVRPYGKRTVHCMWSAKTKVIPGATGIISKSFRKYLSNLPGKHTKELLQAVIFGTAHLRKNHCYEDTKHSP